MCVLGGAGEHHVSLSAAREPPKASSDPVLLHVLPASPKGPRAWVISGVGRAQAQTEEKPGW